MNDENEWQQITEDVSNYALECLYSFLLDIHLFFLPPDTVVVSVSTKLINRIESLEVYFEDNAVGLDY
jgi:hypothetical protein